LSLIVSGLTKEKHSTWNRKIDIDARKHFLVEKVQKKARLREIRSVRLLSREHPHEDCVKNDAECQNHDRYDVEVAEGLTRLRFVVKSFCQLFLNGCNGRALFVKALVDFVEGFGESGMNFVEN
jgi:hypothetical protein